MARPRVRAGSRRVRAGLLLALLASIPLLSWPRPASGQEEGAARRGTLILFLVDNVSFEELMAVPTFRRLSRSGGAALMTTRVRPTVYRDLSIATILSGVNDGGSGSMTTVLQAYGVRTCFLPSGSRNPRLERCPSPELVSDSEARTFFVAVRRMGSREGRRAASQLLSDLVGGLSVPRTLVLVVSVGPSAAMDVAGDEVMPVVLAQGPSPQILAGRGPIHGLTSDATRRDGLVSNLDVAPTILGFFGVPIPPEMKGQPIRVAETGAPFDLHQRHLEHRRIRVPVQVGEVSFIAGLGVVAIGVLVALGVRGSLPSIVVSVMRFLALCGVALPIPLLLGGILPRLTYWVVVPFVVLSVLGLATLSLAARWSGPVGPLSFLGAIGLGVLLADALLGWRGAGIPLLGGTMFDGVRFYGLPNAFTALLLASALFVAFRLDPLGGLLLLVGAGLFAGFPGLGADIGGSISLFAAAGLWWVLRTRASVGPREIAFAGGLVAIGLAVVLLAHRYLSVATHASRFADETGTTGDAARAFLDRLEMSLRMLNDAPAAAIPLLGLPIILWLVLARSGPVGRGLDLAGRAWRDILVVLVASGILAFFVNDTGVAAAAPVFLYAMAGITYPALAVAAAPVQGPSVRELR